MRNAQGFSLLSSLSHTVSLHFSLLSASLLSAKQADNYIDNFKQWDKSRVRAAAAAAAAAAIVSYTADLEVLDSEQKAAFTAVSEFTLVANPLHASGLFYTAKKGGQGEPSVRKYEHKHDKGFAMEYAGEGGKKRNSEGSMVFGTGALNRYINPEENPKASDAVKQRWPYIRLLLNKHASLPGSSIPLSPYDWKGDLLNQVYCSLSIFGGSSPLSQFRSPYASAYVERLDQSHRPPPPGKLLRLLRITRHCQHKEFLLILDERRIELRNRFVGVNHDAWSNKLVGSFGTVVVNLLAKKRRVRISRTKTKDLFLSDETAERLKGKGRIVDELGFELMEFQLGFEKIEGAHTGANLSSFMKDILFEGGVRPGDLRQVSTDAANNGVLAVEIMLDDIKVSPDVDANTCIPHALHNSALSALGVNYKVSLNPTLKTLQKHVHQLIASMRRSEKRQRVLTDVQKAENVAVHKLVPGVPTRWNALINEFGSINKAGPQLKRALATIADDPDLMPSRLSADPDDADHVSYVISAQQSLLSLQIEGSFDCGKYLNVALQASKNVVVHSLLLGLKTLVADAKEPTFFGYAYENYRSEGQRTRVKYSNLALLGGDTRMDPAIAKMRVDYASQVTNRANLDAEELDPALAFGALLNPTLYDVVTNGLFTSDQCNVSMARLKEECCGIADVLWPRSADDDDDDEDDEEEENTLYGVRRPPSLHASATIVDTPEKRTARELELLKQLKQQGFQPEMEHYVWKLGELPLGGRVKGRRYDFERGDGKKDNLANYYVGYDAFDIVSFYRENKADFPILWVLVQKVACMVSTSAGSERAFTKAGFTAHPERANLCTKTYERLVIVNINMSNVFVLPEDIEKEFLERKKARDWDLTEDIDDRLFCVEEEVEGWDAGDDNGADE